ncbi:MAG: hypothetical protein CMF25_07485 [Kangiellaceae bacterium]|nr:hypothetical protein [Kangiellaceae bacterium]|tara:strand:+ start:3258 stop:4142 length:885 start_codon:yes stop_codon:yes gene_type:complete
MPDVFILGFTKCATTSLYDQLLAHEDVSNTKRKEPHFHFAQVLGDRFEGPADNDAVSQMFVTNEAEYEKLYEPGKLSIDGSAMSIEHPQILEIINQQYPNAKHIIMLRNPVERAFSAYSHLIRDARETASFREALEQDISGNRSNFMPIWHLTHSSRYVIAVQNARRLFGERLKVVSYHDYVRNNKETMDEVARFLGLTPIQWHQEHANRSGQPKSKLFQKVLMRKSFLKSIFVSVFPQKMVKTLKRQLMERNTGEKPRLDEKDRAYFLSAIADEIDFIEAGALDSDMLRSFYQ